MAHPWHHAESSARKYGGKPEDYIEIHAWFDDSKCQMANFRHRALRHHAYGIFECERNFGVTITNSDGKKIPVRFIGEQHVREDCGGRIPSVQDWLRGMKTERWMNVGDLRDDVPQEALSEDADALGPESLEAWRQAVIEGKTTLGHAEWLARLRTMRENR